MNDIERVLQSIAESQSVMNKTNNTTVKTIEKLFSYIQELEARVKTLELENIMRRNVIRSINGQDSNYE